MKAHLIGGFLFLFVLFGCVHSLDASSEPPGEKDDDWEAKPGELIANHGSIVIKVRDLLRSHISQLTGELIRSQRGLKPPDARDRVLILEEIAYISFIEVAMKEDDFVIVHMKKGKDGKIDGFSGPVLKGKNAHAEIAIPGSNVKLQYKLIAMQGDTRINNNPATPTAVMEIAIQLEIEKDFAGAPATYGFGPDKLFEIPYDKNILWTYVPKKKSIPSPPK